MIRQQRRYQWPWMWVLCLGVLGMTLVGCGDSSPTSDTTGTPTVVEQLSYDLTTDGDITVGQGQPRNAIGMLDNRVHFGGAEAVFAQIHSQEFGIARNNVEGRADLMG